MEARELEENLSLNSFSSKEENLSAGSSFSEDKKNPSVDALFSEVEKRIEEMDAEDISLEEIFRLYEEGAKLLKEAGSYIDEIEKKVQVIAADGSTRDFE